MQNKAQRHLAIRQILSQEQIHRQEDLLHKINQLGFETTQATLSRDLKEMNVGTRNESGIGHIYTIHDDYTYQSTPSGVLEAVVSVELSAQMAVIKTKPGFANSVAVHIDGRKYTSIAGTIAGNDTIFAALRNGALPSDFINEIQTQFPNWSSILKP